MIQRRILRGLREDDQGSSDDNEAVKGKKTIKKNEEEEDDEGTRKHEAIVMREVKRLLNKEPVPRVSGRGSRGPRMVPAQRD
jgi:hypothetical protein